MLYIETGQMDNNLIKQQLIDWMVNFVETPHTSLGKWAPCPYARQARINNKIGIKFCTVPEFIDVVNESIIELEEKDVVVVCFDHKSIDYKTLQLWVNETNSNLLMPQNYVILEDHPDNLEFVHGVNMNFGHCGLLVIQKLSKLNEASAQLRSKGYYNTWSNEELNDVVNWRVK